MLASHYADGAWFLGVLDRAGHQVDWTLAESDYADTLEGIIPSPLEDIPDPDSYDLVVFDDASHGDIADSMRKVTPTLGSSEFAQRLEDDRLFGIEFMEKCGIPVPPYESFDDVGKAVKWIKKGDRKCVFKPSGNVSDKALTYCAKSAEDMEQYLEKLTSKVKVKEFILQEFVAGTEVSTNAWFNGNEFFAMDHTFEEKKFLSGGLGPNTGCSGNVVWMPQQSDQLFQRGLYKAREALAEVGFVGPIDLNTIATEGEIYGLEWTPRFGYEGTCNLTRLLPVEFGEFLYEIASGGIPNLPGSKYNYAATIRLSVPPYPNPSSPKKHAGIPVKGIDPENLESFYLKDVLINDAGEMETLGIEGFVGAPIGCGDTIKQAFEECEAAIRRLQVPDLQWRVDVRKCCERRYEELFKNGWLKREGALA